MQVCYVAVLLSGVGTSVFCLFGCSITSVFYDYWLPFTLCRFPRTNFHQSWTYSGYEIHQVVKEKQISANSFPSGQWFGFMGVSCVEKLRSRSIMCWNANEHHFCVMAFCMKIQLNQVILLILSQKILGTNDVIRKVPILQPWSLLQSTSPGQFSWTPKDYDDAFDKLRWYMVNVGSYIKLGTNWHKLYIPTFRTVFSKRNILLQILLLKRARVFKLRHLLLWSLRVIGSNIKRCSLFM